MRPPMFDELEGVVATLLDRHLAATKEWFPHELVPWDRAAGIERGKEWHRPAGCQLSDGVLSAILVNLLTEDNLPYYTRALSQAFGVEGAWGEWACRWTAEEGRHSIVLRDWVTVSQLLDPVLLERGRMQQVSAGIAPEPWSAAATIIYVALQELATRVAHFNTARALDDPAGYQIMKRVAADENHHFLFYRDLSAAALEIDASTMLVAMNRVVREFNMPGTGITDFKNHQALIAGAGIYNLAIFHDQVLAPTLRFWQVEEMTGLTAEAEKARDGMIAHTERVCRIAQKIEEQRQDHVDHAAPRTSVST